MHDWSTINLRPKYYINPNLNVEANVSYKITKSSQKWERETFKFFDANGAPADLWANNVNASQGVSESQLTARALVNYTKDLRGMRDKLYVTLDRSIDFDYFSCLTS